MKIVFTFLCVIVFYFASLAQVKLVSPASTNSSSNPLLMIDSVMVEFESFRYLSPQNIDHVTIYKDATAHYGSRTVNGVIVVSMKKNSRMLDINQLLKINKADSVIGKSMIVNVNASMIKNIEALKMDSSIIQSVHIKEMMNANSIKIYNITIQVNLTRPGSANFGSSSANQIMIRGNDISI